MFPGSEAAERFLKSPNMRALTAHPEVSEFYVRHFSTLTSLNTALPVSAVTLQPAGLPPVSAPSVWQSGADHVVDQRN